MEVKGVGQRKYFCLSWGAQLPDKAAWVTEEESGMNFLLGQVCGRKQKVLVVAPAQGGWGKGSGEADGVL